MEARLQNLKFEKIWTEKTKYDAAERRYQELKAKGSIGGGDSCKLTPLADEVAKARQKLMQVKESHHEMESKGDKVDAKQFKALEAKLNDVEKLLQMVTKNVDAYGKRLEKLEAQILVNIPVKAISTPAPKPNAAVADDDDDDVDLFGSDSEGEDETAAKLREERLAAYNAKKSKKPALIAKSSIILDIKPWDDETDMKMMEGEVRKIVMDGLLWGASKLVPLAYGIHKLQINCVVEDEKVSIDLLTETIQELEDYVQSVDIAAFNKI